MFVLCKGRGEQGKIRACNTGIKRTGGAGEAEEERAGVRSSKRVGREKRRGEIGLIFRKRRGAEGSKPTPTERVFGIYGGLSTSYPVVYYVIRHCPWGKIAHTE